MQKLVRLTAALQKEKASYVSDRYSLGQHQSYRPGTGGRALQVPRIARRFPSPRTRHAHADLGGQTHAGRLPGNITYCFVVWSFLALCYVSAI